MSASSDDVQTGDASRFTHGAIYHALFDGPLAEARRVAIDLISERSAVLDIASGTGQLCFELRAQKNCRVVGIDLSRRMVEFARRRNPYEDVTFVHGDGTDLAGLGPTVFDYATVLFLLHEVSGEKQVQLLNEASRIAKRVIVVDSQVPLPRNAYGIALRIVEAVGGREHYRRFADYLASGGIDGILADPRVRTRIVHRSVFWHNCREVMVLET